MFEQDESVRPASSESSSNPTKRSKTASGAQSTASDDSDSDGDDDAKADQNDCDDEASSSSSSFDDNGLALVIESALTAVEMVVSSLPQFLSAHIATLLKLLLHPALMTGKDLLVFLIYSNHSCQFNFPFASSFSNPRFGSDLFGHGQLIFSGVVRLGAVDTERAGRESAVAPAAARCLPVAASVHQQWRCGTVFFFISGLFPSIISLQLVVNCLMFHFLLIFLFQSTIRLFSFLSQICAAFNKEDVRQHHKSVFKFFLVAFDTRRLFGTKLLSIDTVENAMVQSFLSLVVKLNESQLKPLFLKVLEWVGLAGVGAVTASSPSAAVDADDAMDASSAPSASVGAAGHNINRSMIAFRLIDALLDRLKVRSNHCTFLIVFRGHD